MFKSPASPFAPGLVCPLSPKEGVSPPTHSYSAEPCFTPLPCRRVWPQPREEEEVSLWAAPWWKGTGQEELQALREGLRAPAWEAVALLIAEVMLLPK